MRLDAETHHARDLYDGMMPVTGKGLAPPPGYGRLVAEMVADRSLAATADC